MKKKVQEMIKKLEHYFINGKKRISEDEVVNELLESYIRKVLDQNKIYFHAKNKEIKERRKALDLKYPKGLHAMTASNNISHLTSLESHHRRDGNQLLNLEQRRHHHHGIKNIHAVNTIIYNGKVFIIQEKKHIK
jgi:hypothetical protein